MASNQVMQNFETFPSFGICHFIHPVNLAYEAATADLDDVNMIDPFHLEAYGETTVNYNRDVEIFPVLNAMFEKILGTSPYKSPTDMGVNMVGYCIVDDEAAKEASNCEIIRRYYKAKVDYKRDIQTKIRFVKLKSLCHRQISLTKIVNVYSRQLKKQKKQEHLLLQSNFLMDVSLQEKPLHY